MKCARDNCVEPIPLVQSLGHVEWMFKNGQNLDLAEDPREPFAYCVTNPATYDFIEKIFDEAIDLFHPQFFHIGHDEVVDRGEYPYRPASKKLSVAVLFGTDVRRLDAYFRPKNIRMMLWGDMLLNRAEASDAAAHAASIAEAEFIRAAVPEGCDHLRLALSTGQARGVQKSAVAPAHHFPVIACTWYNPQNIYTFAQAVRDDHAFGLLQTTWAGYNIDEQAVAKELRQFAAYILAARVFLERRQSQAGGFALQSG